MLQGEEPSEALHYINTHAGNFSVDKKMDYAPILFKAWLKYGK